MRSHLTVPNSAYSAGISLANHLDDIYRFCTLGYAEDLAIMEARNGLTADGRVKGAHKLSAPTIDVSAEHVTAARVKAARLRQLAQLAAELDANDLACDDIDNAAERTLAEIARIAPAATETWEPSKLAAHGHGLTLKSEWVRTAEQNGERVERIRRDDSRDILDNNNSGNGYSAAHETGEDALLAAALEVQEEGSY